MRCHRCGRVLLPPRMNVAAFGVSSVALRAVVTTVAPPSSSRCTMVWDFEYAGGLPFSSDLSQRCGPYAGAASSSLPVGAAGALTASTHTMTSTVSPSAGPPPASTGVSVRTPKSLRLSLITPSNPATSP